MVVQQSKKIDVSVILRQYNETVKKTQQQKVNEQDVAVILRKYNENSY